MSITQTKVLLADIGNPAASLRPYETVRHVLREMSPADVVNCIAEAGLRGRGGAGFPTGTKWRAVAEEASEIKYIVANGAEGEPGTWKDRHLLKERPHLVIAGMVIAAYAVGARKGYIYIHHEAEDCMAAMRAALDEAGRLGYLGENILGSGFSLDLDVHVAGVGYVAGEETAVLQFIEGKPAIPRAKPPYPTVKGLWGQPTLVNNVETLANVEPILRHGASWYRSLGTDDTPGTIIVSLNGVKRPGVYEVEAGVTVRDVIYELGGGPAGGEIKAVLPGGYASAFLRAEDLDVPMEYGALRARGSSLGCATIHVFDRNACMVEVTTKVMQFFAAETCGQCFPCRKGTRDFLKLSLDLERGKAGDDWYTLLEAVFSLTGRKTICGLDKAASAAMSSAVKLFREEFEQHLTQTSCESCYSGAARP